MSVYVDDMCDSGIGDFGRMKMSHMFADSTDELKRMASRIGVDLKWIQYPGTPNEHFDVAKSKRALAIKAGAIACSMRFYAAWKPPHLRTPEVEARMAKYAPQPEQGALL